MKVYSMEEACKWMCNNNRGVKLEKQKHIGYYRLISKYPINKLIFPPEWFYTEKHGLTNITLMNSGTLTYCEIAVKSGILSRINKFLEKNGM